MDEGDCKPPLVPMVINDKLLEICGATSAAHIGQIHSGLAKPQALKQCKKVSFEFDVPWPLQIDGEPWQQPAGRVTICHQTQSTLLAVPKKAHPSLKIPKS